MWCDLCDVATDAGLTVYRRRHEQAALYGSKQTEAAAQQLNLQPATDKTALGQSAEGAHESVDLCINTSAGTSAGPEEDQSKGDAPRGGCQASTGHKHSDQQSAEMKQAQTHSSMPMQQGGSGRVEGKGNEQSDRAVLETSKGSSRQDCAKPPSSAAGNIHFPCSISDLLVHPATTTVCMQRCCIQCMHLHRYLHSAKKNESIPCASATVVLLSS